MNNGNFKCKCCERDIPLQQFHFSGLCGLCDTGACRNPSIFHSLEKELKELKTTPNKDK
ncbi:MAG: hypothetical protein AABY22_12965 [Nanoarchaeota archaeon]